MKTSARWLDILVAAIGCFFALIYAWTNPVFEAPDEPEHLAYVNFVASRKTLPNQNQVGQFVPQGHHHPLYYVLAAAIVVAIEPDDQIEGNLTPNPSNVRWGGRDSNVPVYYPPHKVASELNTKHVRIVRSVNAVLVGIMAFLAIQLARRYVPDPFPLVAGLACSTLPQFTFIGGAISNDILAALLSLATLYALSVAVEKSTLKQWIWVGLWLGLAILAKKSCLVMIVPTVLAAMIALPKKEGPKARLQDRILWMSVCLGAAFVICGWYFIRNQMIYGEVLATRMEEVTNFPLVDPKPMTDRYFATTFLRISLTSFIGMFGWMNVQLDEPILLLYALAGFVGIMPCLASAFDANERRVWWICVTTILATIAGVYVYNLTYTQPQGRLFFPCLGAVSLLVAMGCRTLLSRASRNQPVMILAIGLILTSLNACSWQVNRSFHTWPNIVTKDTDPVTPYIKE